MRRVERFPVSEANSMAYWPRITPLWRVIWNFTLIELSRFIPFLRFKNFLLRLAGVKVAPSASVGLMAMFDILRPDLISIGENTIIGYNATILTHEFLPREYRLGPVEIGSWVLVGANATILPGIKIGDGAVVAAGAVVTRDVPSGALVAGVPARVVKREGEP